MNLHTDILDTPDIFWDEESIDLTLKWCICAFLLLTISITHVCIYIYTHIATGTLEKKKQWLCNIVHHDSLLVASGQTYMYSTFWAFRFGRNDLKRSMWLVEPIWILPLGFQVIRRSSTLQGFLAYP